MLTKEQTSEKNRLYHLNNREKVSARKKRWALANPDSVNKFQRQHPDQHRAHVRNFARRHPDVVAAQARKQNYGVSQEWFENTLKEQNNKCAICFIAFGKPCVDHDHDTGKARALLCHTCNVVLGFAHEDPTVLANAAQYILRHKEPNGNVTS